MGRSYTAYFLDEKNQIIVADLLQEIEWDIDQRAATTGEQKLTGMTFVITGSLEHFENRDQLKELIEEQGGKNDRFCDIKTNYSDQQRHFIQFFKE